MSIDSGVGSAQSSVLVSSTIWTKEFRGRVEHLSVGGMAPISGGALRDRVMNSMMMPQGAEMGCWGRMQFVRGRVMVRSIGFMMYAILNGLKILKGGIGWQLVCWHGRVPDQYCKIHRRCKR